MEPVPAEIVAAQEEKETLPSKRKLVESAIASPAKKQLKSKIDEVVADKEPTPPTEDNANVEERKDVEINADDKEKKKAEKVDANPDDEEKKEAEKVDAEDKEKKEAEKVDADVSSSKDTLTSDTAVKAEDEVDTPDNGSAKENEPNDGTKPEIVPEVVKGEGETIAPAAEPEVTA